MPADDNLQIISVTDFSPGIYDDWFAAGGAVKSNPGAARKTGTFGCCSSRSGSLIPGPKRVNRVKVTSNENLAHTPDGTQRIMAFRCMSPVWDRTEVGLFETGEVREFPDLIAVAFEAFVGTGGTFAHHSLCRVYKVYQEPVANPALNAVATFDVGAHNAGAFTERFKYGWSSIDLTKDSYTDPTIVGYPVVAFEFTSNKDVREFQRKIFPDTATPTVDSSTDILGLDQSGGFAGYALFAHQDRMMLLDRSININLGTSGEVPTDLIVFSAVNDIMTSDTAVVSFVAENPGLFGAWATVNASEAFFVKQQRGGFVVRGDVNNPTVVRLPGLPPTFDAINIAVAARDGKVYYGSRNGIFAWSGGDTADLVSSQLDGWFWDPGNTSDVSHTKGSFSAVDRYLFAPNNFFYDIEAKGWWRLTDAEDDDYLPYAWYDVSAAGAVIGAPNFISEDQDVLADWYDIYQGQPEYNFVSQPLVAAKNRSLTFRALTIKAQGKGEVTFTLYGRRDDANYRPVTFRVDSDQPKLYHLPLSADAYDPYYSIHAKSDNDADPAPEIISFDLGYHPGSTAERS